MRIILLTLTVLISLGCATLGYLALNHQLALLSYVAIMTVLSIGLTFLAGHFLYKCFFEKTPH